MHVSINALGNGGTNGKYEVTQQMHVSAIIY